MFLQQQASKLASVLDENKTLRDQLESSQLQNRRESKELSDEIQALMTQQGQADDQIENLNQRLGLSVSKNKALQQKNEKLFENVGDLNKELGAVRDKNGQLKDEVRDLQKALNREAERTRIAEEQIKVKDKIIKEIKKQGEERVQKASKKQPAEPPRSERVSADQKSLSFAHKAQNSEKLKNTQKELETARRDLFDQQEKTLKVVKELEQTKLKSNNLELQIEKLKAELSETHRALISTHRTGIGSRSRSREVYSKSERGIPGFKANNRSKRSGLESMGHEAPRGSKSVYHAVPGGGKIRIRTEINHFSPERDRTIIDQSIPSRSILYAGGPDPHPQGSTNDLQSGVNMFYTPVADQEGSTGGDVPDKNMIQWARLTNSWAIQPSRPSVLPIISTRSSKFSVWIPKSRI